MYLVVVDENLIIFSTQNMTTLVIVIDVIQKIENIPINEALHLLLVEVTHRHTTLQLLVLV